jgi:DegT/DnrJ/EryC1/StrS aminotransferase family
VSADKFLAEYNGSFHQRIMAWGLEQPPKIPRDLLRRNSVASSDNRMTYVGSGKAAIALVLDYLRTKGVLRHKMAPILVPPWLGTWVYAQMLSYGFPTIGTDADAAVVFCYHQYGFPQNMDRVLDIAKSKKMVVIEDCAHAARSFYKGHWLGSLGDYGIFSFSKFTFCFALGGITSGDPEFNESIAGRLKRASSTLRFVVNGLKLFDEWNKGLESPRAVSMFNGLRSMAYARYGDQILPGRRALALWNSKRELEMAAREKNYQLLRAETGRFDVCKHLEADGIAPYAVPLSVHLKSSQGLVTALQEHGIKAGIYRFDFARCVFEPDMRPCVLVPIHSGMTGGGMQILIDVITKNL